MKSLAVTKIALLKNEAILLICLFGSVCAFSQGMPKAPSIVGQLPIVTPPSPTVAALMKFEEISVNNYTGVPDVSIPLYSIESLSKDITLEVALKYHPSSIAVEEVAGYTGLGWSIFAGGSISRTVKGAAPDEISVYGTSGRVGILQDFIEPPGSLTTNRYNQVVGLLGTPGLTEEQIRMIGEYGYGVSQAGTFDTEHDLFQYNFMGHTGRFFIKRDLNTGLLIPVKLDNDNAIQIILDYTQSEYDHYRHKYDIVFNGFQLYDDRGYKYVFSAKETTVETNVLAVETYGGTIGSGGPQSAPQLTFDSAFNLTEIWDNNNKLLVSITYTDAPEMVSRKTSSLNWISNTLAQNIIQEATGPVYGLPPSFVASSVHSNTTTKKVKIIEVINKARITFETLLGRQDSNLNILNHDGPYLNAMTVKNWYGDLIKQFNFSYDYAPLGNDINRMILTSVIDKNILNNEQLAYQLSYKAAPSAGNPTQDYWGYYSERKGGNREPDEMACTTNVLEKMTLPTGGSIVFHYGPNTYSFIGADPVTDFSIDNPYVLPLTPQIPEEGEVGIFPSAPTMPTDVFFVPKSPVVGGQFYIREDGDYIRRSINTLGNTGVNDGTGASEIHTLKPNVKYYLGYTGPQGSPGGTRGTVEVYVAQQSGSLTTFGAGESTTDNQWLMGGGVRIDSISYYTDNNSLQLAKVKHYDYRSFANPLLSSGSLAFAKPIFKYNQLRTAFYNNINEGTIPGTTGQDPRFPVFYTTTTTHNNLSFIRTQGSDVGYKNVTVSETANGKSEFTYTSPIDYPGIYEIHPPFRTLPNEDYKRGLLLNEKHYSELRINDTTSTYKPIAETIYKYPTEDFMHNESIRIGHAMDPSPSWAAPQYDTYGAFKSCTNINCLSTYGNEEYHFLSLGLEVEDHFGWPSLQEKVTKEYFYPESSTTPKIVSNTQKFSYSFDNKKLKSSTVTNSFGETLTTNYYYDSGWDSRNRIGMVKKIETRRNEVLVETKDITYSKTAWGGANQAYLPKTISTAKGNNPLEPRVQFIKYDEYSNPVETREENGMSTVYIVGYHSSQLIAVIENITYDEINSSLITAAQLASNSNNEALLLEKLSALRASLPSTALVSTYTHKPLVGVSTVTDARGYRTTHIYDGFGRLKEVRDANNNLLSENDYHYVTE